MIGGQKNAPNTMPVEIFMVGLGNHGTRPTLFIRTESEMLIYRAFRYPRGKHLKIRFRKINHDIVIPRVMPMEQDDEFVQDNFRRIRYFGKILEVKHGNVLRIILLCGWRLSNFYSRLKLFIFYKIFAMFFFIYHIYI